MVRVVLVTIALLAATGYGWARWRTEQKNVSNTTDNSSLNSLPQSRFEDSFEGSTALSEAYSMDESASMDWWVSSGGWFYQENGVGSTVQGALPTDDPWVTHYKESKALRTDDGTRPQNIFRLVQRQTWLNSNQQVFFNMQNINLNEDDTRNQTNGVFLMSRYQDDETLYYTGLRVDGYISVKRKYAGEYTTLVHEPIFPGKYDRDTNPNLIPLNEWIGLRAIVQDHSDGVEIRVWLDLGRTGEWTEVAHVIDRAQEMEGQAVIKEEGHVGVRSDFMDVLYDDFRVEEL